MVHSQQLKAVVLQSGALFARNEEADQNQKKISLSSCEAAFCAASACAREWLGLAELFTTKFQFVSKLIQTRQDTFCSAGDQVDSNTSRYDAVNTVVDVGETSFRESSGHEERHSRSFHETL